MVRDGLSEGQFVVQDELSGTLDADVEMQGGLVVVGGAFGDWGVTGVHGLVKLLKC